MDGSQEAHLRVSWLEVDCQDDSTDLEFGTHLMGGQQSRGKQVPVPALRYPNYSRAFCRNCS